MSVRTGEEVLRRMKVTRGCGPAAAAQLRVIAVNLGVTYLCLRAFGAGSGGGGRRRLRLDPGVRPPPLPEAPAEDEWGEDGDKGGGGDEEAWGGEVENNNE